MSDRPVDVGVSAIPGTTSTRLRCAAWTTTAHGAGDVVYYGNVFTGTTTTTIGDQNLDGTTGSPREGPRHGGRKELELANRGNPGAYLAEPGATGKTPRAITCPHPEGTEPRPADADNQLKTGRWQIRLSTRTRRNTGAQIRPRIADRWRWTRAFASTRTRSLQRRVAVLVNEVRRPRRSTRAARRPLPDTSSKEDDDHSQDPAAPLPLRGARTDEGRRRLQLQVGNSVSTRPPRCRRQHPVRGGRYTITASTRTRTARGRVAAARAAPGASPSRHGGVRTARPTWISRRSPAGPKRVFLLSGGCDDDKYSTPRRPSPTLSSSRTSRLLTLDDIVVTLRAVVPDGDNTTDPGAEQRLVPYVTVRSGAVTIDKVSPASSRPPGSP